MVMSEKKELGNRDEVWFKKAFENKAVEKIFGLVRKEIGDVFESEEDIIIHAIFYGLRGMLNYDLRLAEREGEFEIGTKLDRILDEFRLEKVGVGKLDRILEMLSRVVAEGVRLEGVMGIPGRIDQMQADLDEVLRFCGRIEGIRKDSGENKKVAEEIRTDTLENKETIKAIEEKVNLLFEMAEDLLYGEKYEDVVPKDYFNEHLGKRNVFLKLSEIIEEVLEVLGKGDKKVRMPF